MKCLLYLPNLDYPVEVYAQRPPIEGEEFMFLIDQPDCDANGLWSSETPVDSVCGDGVFYAGGMRYRIELIGEKDASN